MEILTCLATKYQASSSSMAHLQCPYVYVGRQHLVGHRLNSRCAFAVDGRNSGKKTRAKAG